MPKQDDTEWKFQTYRGNKLAYDMLYDPISSDNKERLVDILSGNRGINLKILTTNIENFLVCQKCVQEKALQMKS